MKNLLKSGIIAAGVFCATAAGATDYSSLYGTYSLPGESCDEWNPSESIMVVAKGRVEFLEVGCDVQGNPGELSKDTYRFELSCSGIDSGPWESVLVLQAEPDEMVMQTFEEYDPVQHLKRCPH